MEKLCGLGTFLKLRVHSLTPVLILSNPLVVSTFTIIFQKLGPRVSELIPETANPRIYSYLERLHGGS